MRCKGYFISDAVGCILDSGDAFVNSVGTALTRETRELVGGADQGRNSIHFKTAPKLSQEISLISYFTIKYTLNTNFFRSLDFCKFFDINFIYKTCS